MTRDDLKDVIARIEERLADLDAAGVMHERFSTADVSKLLAAAEAGMRARDAALEEAAQLADEWDERDGVWGVGTAIRDLKGAA